MPFDAARVQFTEQEISLAKELDDMIEALTGLSDADKVQESIEAALAMLGVLPSAVDRKVLLLKIMIALLLDNVQEHVPFFEDEEE